VEEARRRDRSGPIEMHAGKLGLCLDPTLTIAFSEEHSRDRSDTTCGVSRAWCTVSDAPESKSADSKSPFFSHYDSKSENGLRGTGTEDRPEDAR
jgi:hypothetical protein